MGFSLWTCKIGIERMRRFLDKHPNSIRNDPRSVSDPTDGKHTVTAYFRRRLPHDWQFAMHRYVATNFRKMSLEYSQPLIHYLFQSN